MDSYKGTSSDSGWRIQKTGEEGDARGVEKNSEIKAMNAETVQGENIDKLMA